MTKDELKEVADEVRAGKSYENSKKSPLMGLALPNFPKETVARKEAIVNHCLWQSARLDGKIDEEELQHTLNLLKEKRVIMV